jgi:lipoate-protein ligase A
LPEPAGVLRVIDFGEAIPLRSQTLWHAVAAGVGRGGPPTLSFVRTSAPYVSVGFHRSLDEVDRSVCRARGWPVLRRQVGGGPVFMDRDQLCFQVSVPAADLPASRVAATRMLLEPALCAFRAAGLDAHLDPAPEVVVGDRKVCGHAAAQIGSAVVLVGNLIERFDHQAAASILRAPDPTESGETLALMRRYVAFDGDGPAPDPDAFVGAAIGAYASALGLEPVAGGLSPAERDELRRLDRQFGRPSWVAGPGRPPRPAWTAKIRSGVWRGFCARGAGRLGLSVVGGRIAAARVEGFGPDRELAARLEGAALEAGLLRAVGGGPADFTAAVGDLVAVGRLH